MYIGKDGGGRRYKCPLYKCDKHGAVISVDPPRDKHLGLQPAAPARLRKLGLDFGARYLGTCGALWQRPLSIAAMYGHRWIGTG